MLSNLSQIDKVSIVALAKKIEDVEKTKTISQLAEKLAVPLMSESRNRERLMQRIADPRPDPGSVAIPRYAKLILSYLLEKSFAVRPNNSRPSYATWFKRFVIDLKERESNTYSELSEFLGISQETLVGFSDSLPALSLRKMDALSENLAKIWESAPPERRRNLDAFWYYLGKKHQDLSISFKKMRQTMINLGLHHPRGPRTKDHGTNVKKIFSPHALWEGDGKQINLTINGFKHSYLWYAFVEQETTLLVGSNIDRTETSSNFLNALKAGNLKAGTYPIGILIDNRLSDAELSPIHRFCREHNIVLVRTFPGNSKSNGNIENNFSIFEQFVGDLNIIGSTSEEISKSIAQVIVEVFTQLRNHQSRQRLNGETPDEVSTSAKRPEHARDAIEKMATRFQKKEDNIKEKWTLIADARAHFEPLSEQSEIKIKKILAKYPVLDIVAAQAAYLAQIAKYPNETYRSEYFMAILRHKRETKAKGLYNEVYRAGILKSRFFDLEKLLSQEELAKTIINTIEEIQREPTPAHRMLRLDALAWSMASIASKVSIGHLWRLVADFAANARKVTLRFWQLVNESMVDRLGALLFYEIDQVSPQQLPRFYNDSILNDNLC